ncbi:hypothetical protein RJ639_034627, partial [Escallonia herrerae]
MGISRPPVVGAPNIGRSISTTTIDVQLCHHIGTYRRSPPPSISGNETITSKPRSLQLQFLTKISCPVFTGKDIEGEECEPIKLALVDRFTREVVKDGAEAAAGVEILILEGELEDGKRESWTREEFNDKIVREWEGKKSILRGDTHLKLKEGTGTLGRISVTHNSGWMKNCKLRIGARVVDNSFGISIKEAISESFPVKDRRSTLYEKHYPPSLCDEVWRLKNISKKGVYYKHILKADARTWKIIVGHARTCLIGKGMYVYYVQNSQEKTGVVFDVGGVLIGLLQESQFAAAYRLVESASEHWDEVLSFDDESLHMHGSFQSMHSPGPDSPADRNFVTSPTIDDPEINTDGLFVRDDSGQVPYSPTCSPDLNQFWSSVLKDNLGLQSESPFGESHANHETNATDILLIDAEPVHKVPRRKRVGALER